MGSIKRLHFILFLLVSLIFTLPSCGFLSKLISEDDNKKKQKEPTDPKDILKLADKYFEAGGFYSASDYYAKVCSLQPENKYAFHQLAESYRLGRDYKRAEGAYETSTRLDKGEFEYPLDPYKYAVMLKMNGKYDEAKAQFKKYLDSEALDRLKRRDYSYYRDYKGRVETHIKGCNFAKESIEEPVPSEIENMGDKINSAYTEMAPLPKDENELIYGSLRSDTVIVIQSNKKQTTLTANLYSAKGTNGNWDIDTLSGPFNKKGVHTSNGAFSPDGEAFYFTRCEEKVETRQVICAIYRSEKKKSGKWTKPKKLGEDINKPDYTSTHPTLGTYERGSRTYTVLYFASNQPGTRGGMDIWYSIQSFRGNDFRSARNLGRRINTEDDEMTPFFDTKTNTLYFSSEGHVGLGGFDIYRTEGFGRRWEDPENLGYPVNSSVDDIYYTLRDKQHGYFVSNRPGAIALKSETCCDDIWSLRYKKILNFAVTGFVYDEADTNKTPLPGAVVSLYLLDKPETDTGQTEEILLKTDSTTVGDSLFFFDLKRNKDYRLAAVKDGYLVGKRGVSTVGKEESDTFEVNIPIQKIQKEKAFVVKNIYYDFDKASLKPESRPALDSLIMFLQDNPQLIVEISAHTDSKGSDAYNERLSQRRAESVVKFLKEAGIEKERLKAKGYGEAKPIAPNKNPDGSDNPEGRAKNRRTEFKIVGELEDVKLKYEKDILYNIEGAGAGEIAPEPEEEDEEGESKEQ